MKLATVSVIVLIAMLAATAVKAQQRTLYGPDGRVVGRSATDSRGSTVIYDSAGGIVGRAGTDSSGATTLRDSQGRVIGRTTQR